MSRFFRVALSCALLAACSGKVTYVGAGSSGSAGSDNAVAGTAGNGSAGNGVLMGTGGGVVLGTGGSGTGWDGSPLVPIDASGYARLPQYGVSGSWYAYSDGFGADGASATGDCELAGHPASECANVGAPPFGAFLNVAGAMHTVGTVERVGDRFGAMGCPMTLAACDYSAQWGAGIGFDFNDGASGRQPYNALYYNVLGVEFDIDQVPLPGIRLEFPMPNTVDVAHVYMPGSAVSNYVSPLVPGHNRVIFATDLAQPDYVANQLVFDPTQLLAVQFHVPTSTTAPGAYDFTISNFALTIGASKAK